MHFSRNVAKKRTFCSFNRPFRFYDKKVLNLEDKAGEMQP